MKNFDKITFMVARIYGVTVDSIMSRTRKPRPTEARQVAMLACMTVSRLSTLSEVGIYFNRDHASVSHAVKKVKDLRHVYPDVDQMYWALMAEVRRLPDLNYDQAAKIKDE